jgi:hypothetical protein
MAFREKLFIDRLIKDDRISLGMLLRKRRSMFWGGTPITLRIRKYKVAGEVRQE